MKRQPEDLMVPAAAAWRVRETDLDLCATLARDLGVSPLTAKLLCQRGIRTPEEGKRYLNAPWDQMRSPSLFPDMDVAVTRIHQAIRRQERVLVYGDYDVDGVTSMAILVHFLRRTGLDPLTYIPDRLKEGYGFHAETIPVFHQHGVSLIITVDCGISGTEAVCAARRYGIDTIITDHHECSAAIPPALAVLNPKIPGHPFPFRDLAGVGVAFYLLVALRACLRECGIWDKNTQPNMLKYLDLVALGTLADMVPLQEENRVFVRHGFRVISHAERPGVSVLKQQAGISGVVVRARPLVYRVIPRLNAPGRLGCAQDALEMLLCEDLGQVRNIARVVEGRNAERKSIEEGVFRQALRMAKEQLRSRNRPVLVLVGEGWHKGILGIVASRIAQEVLRPVVLLSFEESLGRGSIRSFQGLEVLGALLACGHFLEDFGGHQTAAGFSIKRDNLTGFQEAFERAIAELCTREEENAGGFQLDLWLDDPACLNEESMSELEQLEPFGCGNPEPVLGMRNVRFLNPQVVGGSHFRTTLECGAARFEAIGFGMGTSRFWERRPCSEWNVAFTPQLDDWQGRSRLSLRFLAIQPA